MRSRRVAGRCDRTACFLSLSKDRRRWKMRRECVWYLGWSSFVALAELIGILECLLIWHLRGWGIIITAFLWGVTTIAAVVVPIGLVIVILYFIKETYSIIRHVTGADEGSPEPVRDQSLYEEL